MSKHTPGPWHVIERANGQAFSIGCQVQTKGNFLTTHYIANVADRATPQAEADARLIAAAPQMLEALEELEPFLQWLVIEQGDKVDKLLKNKILPAIKAAKGKV